MADFFKPAGGTKPQRYGKRERLTVADTVLSLTAASYTIQPSAGATKYGANDVLPVGAVIQVQDQAIHFLRDGTGPQVSAISAVAATGILTFTGVVEDGETVTIGDDVYEFDDDAAVTSGNIAVDVSGGVTAAAAVTALVTAITDSDTQGVGAADGTGDTVDLTADTSSAAGNSIVTTETCANASFAEETLTGGVTAVAASGFKALATDMIYLNTFQEVQNFKVVRTGGSSGILEVEYLYGR